MTKQISLTFDADDQRVQVLIDLYDNGEIEANWREDSDDVWRPILDAEISQ